MNGTMNIEIIGETFQPNSKRSVIQCGPLKLPDGVTVCGELVAFGENDMFLHCICSGSGAYYGVFKSDDTEHLYQHLLRLNSECSSDTSKPLT